MPFSSSKDSFPPQRMTSHSLQRATRHHRPVAQGDASILRMLWQRSALPLKGGNSGHGSLILLHTGILLHTQMWNSVVQGDYAANAVQLGGNLASIGRIRSKAKVSLEIALRLGKLAHVRQTDSPLFVLLSGFRKRLQQQIEHLNGL